MKTTDYTIGQQVYVLYCGSYHRQMHKVVRIGRKFVHVAHPITGEVVKAAPYDHADTFFAITTTPPPPLSPERAKALADHIAAYKLYDDRTVQR